LFFNKGKLTISKANKEIKGITDTITYIAKETPIGFYSAKLNLPTSQLIQMHAENLKTLQIVFEPAQLQEDKSRIWPFF
jgi:hypothetical protein